METPDFFHTQLPLKSTATQRADLQGIVRACAHRRHLSKTPFPQLQPWHPSISSFFGQPNTDSATFKTACGPTTSLHSRCSNSSACAPASPFEFVMLRDSSLQIRRSTCTPASGGGDGSCRRSRGEVAGRPALEFRDRKNSRTLRSVLLTTSKLGRTERQYRPFWSTNIESELDQHLNRD
jgi:hypothetical protein